MKTDNVSAGPLHPAGSDIPIRRCWRHGAKSMWSAMAAKDAIYYCPECKKVWGKQVTLRRYW